MNSRRIFGILIGSIMLNAFCSPPPMDWELPFQVTKTNIKLNTSGSPIGIPEPGFGINAALPRRPADWSNEVAGYYYIDYALGSDSQDFGTPLSPRRTIPNPIPAGSYLEIAGQYTKASGGVITLLAQGTGEEWIPGQSGPVWVTKADSSPAVFASYKLLIRGSYLYLDGVSVREGSKVQIGSSSKQWGADHIMVRNCDIAGRVTDGNGSMLFTSGHQDAPVSQIILSNNQVHDSGDINSTNDIDAHLMSISGYSSHVWILGNTLYDASGSGLQVNGQPPNDATHHVYVGMNEVYNTRQAGLWVKYATNVTFSQNYIHHIITTDWSPAKAMGAQYEPNGLWMLYNRIHDVEYGIRVASTNSGGDWRVYAVGNVIYNIADSHEVAGNTSWEFAGIHMHGGTERFILNNYIFNAAHGINGSGTSGSYLLRNNLIANVHQTKGRHIWIEHAKETTSLDANLLFQADSDLRLGWGSSLFNLPAFISNTGKCQNCLEGDVSNQYDPASFLSGVFINSFQDIGNPQLVDAGQIVPDVHCSFARDDPGNPLPDSSDCLHWFGSAPNIGPFDLSTNPPEPNIVEITATTTSAPGIIDLADLEFFTAANNVSGNASSSPGRILTPVFTVQGGQLSQVDSDGFRFFNNGQEVDQGYSLFPFNEDNSIRISLSSGGVTQTALFYVIAGTWSQTPGSFTVSGGDVEKVVEIPGTHGWRYFQVQVKFKGDVDVIFRPNGLHGGYSGLGLAGILLL